MFKDVPYMHNLAKQDLSNKVIDGTIGVLLDDNKQLVFSKTFDEALTKVNKNVYDYAPVDGGASYKDSFVKYFKIPSEYTISATPGATGALTMLLINLKSKTNALVIPKLSWVNYLKMAELNGYDVYYADNDTLEYDYSINEKYDNIVFIINTPASNPIGTTYTKELLDEVTTKANNTKNVHIAFDLAYYHFEDNQEFLFDYGKHARCYYALSLSKTLGVYGFRLGALVSSISEKLAPIARGTWSSIGNIGVTSFVECCKNIEKMDEEVQYNKRFLQKRTKFFVKLLDEYDIHYYSFQNGFFVTIKTNDPDSMVKYLMEQHIYTVTCNEGVRIAVSGLRLDELEIIAEKIKEYIQITCISK